MAITDSALASWDRASHVRFSNIDISRAERGLELRCDVSWRGSWRHPPAVAGGSWDAAWIFVKYCAPKLIQSMPLSSNSGLGGSAPPPVLDLLDQCGRADAKLHTHTDGHRWTIIHESAHESHGLPQQPEIIKRANEVQVKQDAQGKPISVGLYKQHQWLHARVSPGAGPTPGGAVIETSDDRMGIFLYRSADNLGSGLVTFPRLSLHLDIEASDPGMLTLQLFGLEMVYIPQGPFALGDPRGPASDAPRGCFYDSGTSSDAQDRTYIVDSEDAIEIGPGDGAGKQLSYTSGGTIGDGQGPIPAAFPKGYRPFYIMKRQVTQADYAAFMGTLQADAITARYPYGGQGGYRYTVFRAAGGQRIATRASRACNWLSWVDAAAYAAWAGLRPMTELEYEKACRGPIPAVSGEYAWGNTNLAQAQVIVGIEDGTEAVSGNCNIGNSTYAFQGGDGGSGPVRDDAFATPGGPSSAAMYSPSFAAFDITPAGRIIAAPTNTRESTGSSFYGVYALSGNLWEFCVSTGRPEGRVFSGRHGTGALDEYGCPDLAALGWPTESSAGIGYRGGSWYTSTSKGRVADRSDAANIPDYVYRSHDSGFRGVRTAQAAHVQPALPPPAPPGGGPGQSEDDRQAP